MGILVQDSAAQSSDSNVRIVGGTIVRPSRGQEESPSTAMNSSTLSSFVQFRASDSAGSSAIAGSSFGAQPKMNS